MTKTRLFFPFLMAFIFIGCGNNAPEENSKSVSDSTSSAQNVNESFIINTLDSIPMQEFTVNLNDENTFIVAAKGSTYVLPKDCFMDENGNPVNSNVTVQIKELNSIQDFVRGGVSTLSNGKMLRTGGSYFFSAKSNGKELKINPDKKPIALLPSLKKDKEMQFFKGEMTKEGDINWVNDSTKKETKFMEPFKLNLDPTGEYRDALCFEDGMKSYKKNGSTWDYTGKPGQMASCVGFSSIEDWFVKDIRKKIKRLKFIIDNRKKLIAAFEIYINESHDSTFTANPELKGKLIDAGVYDPYQFELEETGWFNCDAYFRAKELKVTVSVVNLKKKKANAFVHFTCSGGNYHVKKFAQNGTVELSYPANRDLKVIAYGKSSKKTTIDIAAGKGTNKLTVCLAD